jgi:hypothetical protein
VGIASNGTVMMVETGENDQITSKAGNLIILLVRRLVTTLPFS